MSTHTHTREGGTGENTSKLRITTQNMGGLVWKSDHTKIVLKLGQKCNILEKARTGIPQMYMY